MGANTVSIHVDCEYRKAVPVVFNFKQDLVFPQTLVNLSESLSRSLVCLACSRMPKVSST